MLTVIAMFRSEQLCPPISQKAVSAYLCVLQPMPFEMADAALNLTPLLAFSGARSRMLLRACDGPKSNSLIQNLEAFISWFILPSNLVRHAYLGFCTQYSPLTLRGR